MTKKEKRKVKFKRIIKIILIISIILVCTYYLINIKTKNIIILNNKYYSDYDIMTSAKIDDYPKFLLLSKSKIKKNLKNLVLIEDVKIKKSFGFKLTLDITEKKILYYVRSTNKYKLSDNTDTSNIDVTGIPTLINFVPKKTEEKFISKFKLLDQEIINMISEIEYSKTKYDEDRFKLYMNDGNEVYITTYKMKSLNKYVDIVKKLNNRKGILYLDSGNYFEIKK